MKPKSLCSVLCILCGIYSVSVIAEQSTTSCSSPLDAGLTDSNRRQCCLGFQKQFEPNWGRPSTSLAKYLETLKSWNCSQYYEECVNRTFHFNRYTDLLYDLSCNRDELIEKCLSTIKLMLNSPPAQTSNVLQDDGTATAVNEVNVTTYQDWQLQIARLNSTYLSPEALAEPCIQAALYEVGNRSAYQELSSAYIPTCEVVWCGFDGETIANRQISIWTCLPQSCKANIWVIISTFAILGLIITFLNLTVVLVIALYPSLRHGQAMYRLSLALADLIMGLLGFSSFIYSLWMATNRIRKPDDVNFPINGRYFSRSYTDYVGFLTNVTIAVSLFTLAAAGVDRLVAISAPLSFDKDSAKATAKKVCVAIWLVTCFCATLPMFVHDLSYSFVLSIAGAIVGRHALILYSILGVLPLLTMWVTSIATYHYGRRHGSVRRHLTVESRAIMQKMEKRLAKTLLLMVGAFTLCCLPLTMLYVAAIFIKSIYPERPRDFDPKLGTAYFTMEFVAFVVVASNSACNFLIYNARSAQFRKTLKKMFKRAAKKTRLYTCLRSLCLCCGRLAYNSHRKMSFWSTTSSRNQQCCARDISAPVSSLQTLPSTEHQESPVDSPYSLSLKLHQLNSTAVKGDLQPVALPSTYNSRRNKTRQRNQSPSHNDSVYKSFKIDAQTDRFFNSVMDKVNENVNTKNKSKGK